MNEPRSEFHRPIAAHDLPPAGRPFRIEAGPEERAALARRFGIVAVNRLQAEGIVLPEASGRRVRLDGCLHAEVVQSCVITLEPVTAVIDAPLQRFYRFDQGQEDEGAAAEIFQGMSDEIPAEPLAAGFLDLGAAAAEQLALELDPYPRKPGAVFVGVDEAESEKKEVVGPLASLAAWRKRTNTA
jgi:hypothetical protein